MNVPGFLTDWKAKKPIQDRIRQLERLLEEETANGTITRGVPDEVRRNISEEVDYLEEQIAAIETRRLCRKAASLGIEIPDMDGDSSWWTVSYYPPEDKSLLTEAGRVRVRRLIRKEYRAKAAFWTGLLVATLAVLTLLKE